MERLKCTGKDPGLPPQTRRRQQGCLKPLLGPLGKPRGLLPRFGLCRNQLRRWLNKGLLPGVTKIQLVEAHSAGNQLQLMKKSGL